MNVTDLSFRDLQYVLAVAAHRHFSQAAEVCAVSQPTLSHQIKRLEKQLGVPLFERSKRRVILTRFGELFVKQAQVLMDQAVTLTEVVKHYQLPLSGPFRLGIIASAGPYLMPFLMNFLHEEYPDLQLILREGYTDVLLTDLKEGRLDAVLAALPLQEPALEIVPLYFESFGLLVPSDHYLARRETVRLNKLDLEEMLLLEEGNCLSNQTLELCPSRRRGESFRYQLTSLETLQHMVAGGLGYAVFPMLSVTKNVLLKKMVTYVPFEENLENGPGKEIVGRTMALCFRKNYPFRASLEALRVIIMKSMPLTVTRLPEGERNLLQKQG